MFLARATGRYVFPGGDGGLKTTDALFVSRYIAGTKGHQIRFMPKSQVTLIGLLFLKVSFSSAAYRAFPIIRYIFPFCSGCHATVRVTLFWIIDIPTDRAYVPVHSCPPFVNWLTVRSAKSKSANISVKSDSQSFLYRSWARFKSIFPLPCFINQAA